jgi:hypothetical protein
MCCALAALLLPVLWLGSAMMGRYKVFDHWNGGHVHSKTGVGLKGPYSSHTKHHLVVPKAGMEQGVNLPLTPQLAPYLKIRQKSSFLPQITL